MLQEQIHNNILKVMSYDVTWEKLSMYVYVTGQK